MNSIQIARNLLAKGVEHPSVERVIKQWAYDHPYWDEYKCPVTGYLYQFKSLNEAFLILSDPLLNEWEVSCLKKRQLRWENRRERFISCGERFRRNKRMRRVRSILS